MNCETSHNSQLIEWGVAGRPLPGETESGDQHVVQPFADGVLAAVADGLGHGPEAAVAGKLAVATLAEHAHEPLTALVERCHQTLRHTRGVAMSVAWINPRNNVMVWLGVGDVDAVLVRDDVRGSREFLLLRGGVVGYQIPPLHASSVALRPGDLLLLATDGIRGNFLEGIDLSGPPQQIADEILARHRKGTDDALVLVARYLGGRL